MNPSPWNALPLQAPYILPEDLPWVTMFNRSVGKLDPRRLRTELLPEPFIGRADAPVVVLLLNPGFSPEDRAHHRRQEFRRSLLANLRNPSKSSHVHLSDQQNGPGHQWWTGRACRRLIETCGLKTVSRNLLAVEFFPYHSRSFGHSHLRVPSQTFSFELVRSAVGRGAEIVCLRGYTTWLGAVPELSRYPRLCRGRNPRTSSISEGNISRYREIVRALTRE